MSTKDEVTDTSFVSDKPSVSTKGRSDPVQFMYKLTSFSAGSESDTRCIGSLWCRHTNHFDTSGNSYIRWRTCVDISFSCYSLVLSSVVTNCT